MLLKFLDINIGLSTRYLIGVEIVTTSIVCHMVGEIEVRMLCDSNHGTRYTLRRVNILATIIVTISILVRDIWIQIAVVILSCNTCLRVSAGQIHLSINSNFFHVVLSSDADIDNYSTNENGNHDGNGNVNDKHRIDRTARAA